MIGGKCQKCRKNLRHHRMMDRACPTGKKHRTLGFTEFHPSQAFEAKPPSKGGASEGRKDRQARRSVKANPCVACGTRGSEFNPVDPAHLRSFKVTQSDDPRGMLPLCRTCHRLQHSEGWGYMVTTFQSVAQAILERGWEISPDPFSKTRVILGHPEIA